MPEKKKQQHRNQLKRRRTKTDTQKAVMIEALEKSLGIVTTAAKAAGIHRQRHYEWMENDDVYRQAVFGISDMALDFVESKLLSLIKEGNPATTIFYMKTKGRHRGYIEKKEIDVTERSDAPQTFKIGDTIIKFN